MGTARRWSTGALLLTPGALVLALSFNSGGYFPEAPGMAAVALALVVTARVLFAREPFAGLNHGVALAAGALALYALWTLASAAWSGSLARALIEFDRVVLYLLVLALFGSMRVTAVQLRWMLRGVAVAVVAISASALVTRLLPELWPIDPELNLFGLSYPLSYANALGLLAALGIVVCLDLTSEPDEPPPSQVLAAASVPLLATTLALTVAIGAVAAGVAATVVLVVLARPRALVAALLAVIPTATVAVIAAGAAEQQGGRVALIVVLSALVAGLMRWVLLAYADRLPSLRAHGRGFPLAAALCGAAAVAVLALLYVGGRPAERADASAGAAPMDTGGLRGRGEQWSIALGGFDESPLLGQGAGTYELLSLEERPADGAVLDAHSLYFEALGELGVVGLALLAAAIIVLLAGSFEGARRTVGPPSWAIFAITLGWAAHAAIDWDWEMPAVTIMAFALGGAALGARASHGGSAGRPRAAARVLVALGALALAVPPGLVAVSQARLDTGVEAFTQGDCRAASHAARSSISALGVRPEPYELLAYCRARAGSPRRAVVDMQSAVERDPQHPEYRHGLSFVRALAERDPGPAIVAARELELLGRLGAEAVERLGPGKRDRRGGGH